MRPRHCPVPAGQDVYKRQPLAMGDAKLQAAADERAKEVAKVASHTRPDGTNCFTVLKEYGVSDTATGEDAAWGETCLLYTSRCV